MRSILSLYPIIAATMLLGAPTLVAKPLSIYGWSTLPKSVNADLNFVTTDALLGGLVCPSLTRLSLSAAKNQLLLLSSLTEQSTDKSKYEWVLKMKPNLRWWSGDAVTSKDLAKYIETYLGREIKRQSLGLWAVPGFATHISDEHTVKVVWDRKPEFGPYVLSAWPLVRNNPQSAAATEYECAGIFAPTSLSSFELTKQSQAKSIYERIEIKDGHAGKDEELWLDFRLPSAATSHPRDRLSDVPAKCAAIDAPIISLVTWNPNSPNLRNPAVRQIMTQLIPRGELLRAGAAFVGDLVSAPIPRSHPGYNRAVLVRSFNIEGAVQELEKLGYKRSSAKGWRVGPDGKTFKLTLLTESAKPGLVEKVLADTFAAIGIEAVLTSDNSAYPDVDGVIAGIRLPWPGLNLLPALHSKAPKVRPFWPLKDASLDHHLELYALSLTKEKPDFTILRKLHTHLYSLEPFTLLVQHKLCATAAGSLKFNPKSVSIGDPDWLIKLLRLPNS